jgi:hypothetical protein
MPIRAPRSALPPQRLVAWSRREDGSMTIFAMFAFVTMLLVAGIAVDMARVEHERVRMQGATDRAALAATTLRTNVSGATPEQLAQAFLEAEGLSLQLGGRVSVVDQDGGRSVTIAPGASMPMGFMRLVGIDRMPIVTRAQAVEALTEPRFEIVMVLDISGSMGSFQRLENMQDAAEDLIETLLRDADPGRVALTIVPYETEVQPPVGMIDHFVNLPAGTGACIDFQDWTSVRNSLLAPVTRRNCPVRMARAVRPFLHDADAAIAVVRGLTAGGTTSIDLGVRSGAMFLDPTIRAVTTQLISNAQVHGAFADLPSAPGTPGVIRAMILLTDGENCCFGAPTSRNPSALIQDDNTVQACSALRAEGVTIYTVAFEAPARGADLMRACATSENHYFNTSGAGVIDAFAGIATHIQTQSLRLTQ